MIHAPDDWDGNDDDLDRAAAKFNQKYAGTDNHGKAMFVSAGSVDQLSTTPKEMNYEASYPQLRDAVLALHGVPSLDGDSYAAFYARLLQLTRLTVQPILSMIAEEETELLAPQFGEGLIVEMLAPNIDDPAVLELQLANDLKARARSLNEWRQLRGLDPWDGPEGEERVGEQSMRETLTDPNAKPDGVKPNGPGLGGLPDPSAIFGKSRFSANGNCHAKAYP